MHRSASPSTPWLRLRTPFRESAALVRELAGHDRRVYACAFSPDGSLLASGSFDRTLKLWDPESGEERATLAGHGSAVQACAFSPDGSLLCSASDDRTLKLWDPASGEERATLAGHSSVYDCAFSPDGALLASASGDGTLRLWDAATGEERAWLAGHDSEVTACAFSPDGALLASASWDRTLKLWDAERGMERAMLPCTPAVRCLALDPLRPLAAYSDSGGGVNLVELGGVQYGPIVVTAVDRGGGPALRCPACLDYLPLRDSWLGQVLDCPRPDCEGRVRVNPFIVKRTRPNQSWWRR